jgi:dimethylargininase
MLFKNAIVKRPCRALVHGLSSAPELGSPVYEKALLQHDAYIAALKRCGLEVLVLPADENYPDSCFVEDTAVLTRRGAIITNPGAPSRRGEIEDIKNRLAQFFPAGRIEYIRSPGALEGGDVMMAGDSFFVGRGGRTNAEGIGQFIGILKKWGFRGIEIPLEKVLHLKTGVNYIENNTMLTAGEFTNKADFASYRRLEVKDHEAYGTNCIWINGTVIMAQGYPETTELVRGAGYPVLLVDTSEFRKLDGGLSCLSLRF